MDAETLHDSTVSIVDDDIDESLSCHNRQEHSTSNGDIVRELSIAKELLMQMELDVACSCERMVNLNLLMIHVAARASEIEAIAINNIEKEENPAASTEKLLELDFLYEIFDSEVGEIGVYIANLQTEILNAREVISSGKDSKKSLLVILDRFDNSEKSLKQSQEELLDLRTQSTKLRTILARQEDKDPYNSENGNFLDISAKTKMQTSEQQRHILRMLEKSLATEMDLEKKLMESKQMEEELKSRILFSAQEVTSLKEQTTTLLQRLFEADCAAEVLKGISREQMGRLQINQFSLNGAVQREAELKSRIESSQSLTSKYKTEAAGLRERIFDVESRADNAEVKCKILEERNAKLKEELEFMRNNSSPAEMVESLKNQLQEADIQLQHASASVEASQEKQIMLYSSIDDMQTVIDGLKSKVLSAETQADNADDKWIMLSESNAELTDELNLLRGRLDCLEASAQQAEEAKAATAKDLNVRTKVIMDLVMRLAIEREHLHKKVSSIVKENKFLVESLQETKKDKFSDTIDHVGKCNEQKEAREGNSSISNAEVGVNEYTPDISQDRLQEPPENGEGSSTASKVETVRTIDAGQLRLKHLLVMAILVLSLSFFYLFNQQK
ncbi:hypothetical protein V2J09_011008 [Rumex salicifolius]